MQRMQITFGQSEGDGMQHYSEKRILVTGINGFIGRHLRDHLVNTLGCKTVYGIDKATCDDPQVFSTDITDPTAINQLLGDLQPNVIFHLAANIKPSRDIDDLDDMMATNINGTVNLMSAVQKCGIGIDCFVSLGTGEEYGNNPQPFVETQLPDPISLYSGTKAAVAMLTRMFFNIYSMPVITVRPSLVYGPGQTDRFFIIQAIKKLLLNQEFEMTQGTQTRDFIYVKDMVEALIELSGTPSLSGEVINVSSGIEHPLRDVILNIKNIIGSTSSINFGAVPYRQTEIMRYAPSSEKITSLIGWKPRISLHEGLSRTIEFIRRDLNI